MIYGANIDLSAPSDQGQPFTFRELADVYISAQRKNRHLMTSMPFFVEQLGSKVVADLDGDDIQDALDALVRRGRVVNRGGPRSGNLSLERQHRPLAPATINRYRSDLQGILTWAQKRRLMPRGWLNPVKETGSLPVDNARIRCLTEDEYRRLLQASRTSAWKMLHVLIKMAVTTGARRGTLLGLRWADVDLNAKRAYAARTKNDEPFVMVFQDDVVFELKKLRGGAHDEHLVFGSKAPYRPRPIETPFKHALKQARIEGVVFHTLRHTHASWLAQKGVPLLAIAESMNHKTLAMTKRYAHLCLDNRAKMLEQVFGTGPA